MARYYVVCLIDSSSFPGRKFGELELEALSDTGLSLLICAAPAKERMSSPEFAALHACFLDDLMGDYTVLPVRFGTILESKEAGLEALARQGAEFSRLMARLAGKVEMGLKALWREEEQDVSPGSALSGREYLLARLEQERVRQRRLARAKSLGEEINSCFPWVTEKKTRYLVTQKLFYNCAFLIDRSELERFWQQVKEVKNLFPGLSFLASGPWPPCTFAGPEKDLRSGV